MRRLHAPDRGMIEVYRGSANTWECDEMGHMNVRFYVSRMMEGLAEFAHQAGMPNAFRIGAQSTLRPRDQHIRFIREAHAGKPFTMRACVLEVTETSLLLYQQIDHADGAPCAAFRTWIDHVDIETGLAFAWTRSVRGKLEALIGEAPAELGPRSLDFATPPRATARMSDADAIDAPVIGRANVSPAQLDATDGMMAEFFIGRVSDSVGHLLHPWREAVAHAAGADGKPVRAGGAVLEYRIVYRRWPVAGDRMVIRSARGFAKEKTHSFVHWVLDPSSGEAWCTMEAVAIALNLDTRKIIPASPAQIAAFKRVAPEGLSV